MLRTVSLEVDLDIVEDVYQARTQQKRECRCGPSWDFEECEVCYAKRNIGEHVLELLDKPTNEASTEEKLRAHIRQLSAELVMQQHAAALMRVERDEAEEKAAKLECRLACWALSEAFHLIGIVIDSTPCKACKHKHQYHNTRFGCIHTVRRGPGKFGTCGCRGTKRPSCIETP